MNTAASARKLKQIIWFSYTYRADNNIQPNVYKLQFQLKVLLRISCRKILYYYFYFFQNITSHFAQTGRKHRQLIIAKFRRIKSSYRGTHQLNLHRTIIEKISLLNYLAFSFHIKLYFKEDLIQISRMKTKSFSFLSFDGTNLRSAIIQQYTRQFTTLPIAIDFLNGIVKKRKYTPMTAWHHYTTYNDDNQQSHVVTKKARKHCEFQLRAKWK